MSGLDSNALERYITGGRYDRSLIRVTCPNCGEGTSVTAESEYGATDWTPCECGTCGAVFEGDEAWVEDEPPDPEPRDDFDDRGRFEPWV